MLVILSQAPPFYAAQFSTTLQASSGLENLEYPEIAWKPGSSFLRRQYLTLISLHRLIIICSSFLLSLLRICSAPRLCNVPDGILLLMLIVKSAAF